MNAPELRECLGCGLFQIVPELEVDTRCDCVRCGTTLRRERSNPLSRGLALNAAGLGLFTIVWTTMLMKVSTMGISHETTLISGPNELVRQGLWPLAIAVGVLATLLALTAEVGLAFVQAAAYGDEVRVTLRPPGPLLFGPLELAWAVLAAISEFEARAMRAA